VTSTQRARWRPSRAGILNVYQYEDETLHFAGGRLLLRGVNGSGKSTAMNMLLPFLLEADTRKIDAAGEQTGVLRSWMLADTDETQRTGYLWIEFVRPDPDAPGGTRHHTVGCGIRANRSTDRVTSWWFSTPLRPRIDFSLTAQRIPLAIDALRAELGTDAVFTTPDDYRAEIARRFFGGADPSGYLALLHQVRNPRVGDRIDADLPRRLQEALPPVPEAAVADAAQPLEDLEGHRHNVTALTQTDRALGSVLDTYRQYARRVLLSAAERAAEAVGSARSATQRRGKSRAAAETAEADERRLQGEVTRLVREHGEAAAALAGLVASPAYRDLQALLARRDHVASLEAQTHTLAELREVAERRTRQAVERVRANRSRLDGDLTRVVDGIRHAERHARAATVRLPLPDPPVLRTQSLGADVEGPDGDALADVDVGPAADAVRIRRQQVSDIAAMLDRAETADAAATAALKRADDADKAAADERAVAAEARATAEQTATRHRDEVLAWADRLAAHAEAVPPAEPGGAAGWLPVPPRPDPGGAELREIARLRVAQAGRSAAELDSALDPVLGVAALRVERAAADAARLAAELAEVRGREELPLPRVRWQAAEPADPALFASLVDFSSGLDDGRRAGIEAACEAAGLLTAAVRADGSVVTGSGELLVAAGSPVSPNLASLLVPAVPDDAGIDAATVAAVLAHVGIGAGSAAALWVADDGRFGAGPLRGRHAKATAEHIGAGARAAARQQRIAELEAQLSELEQRHETEQTAHTALVTFRAGLREIAADVPSTVAVDDAAAAASGAIRDAQRAAQRAVTLRTAATTAQAAAEQTWARAQTAAAEAALALDTAALQATAAAVEDAATVLRLLPDHIATARRSQADLAAAVVDWQHSAQELHDAAARAESAAAISTAARTALTSAEAALGEEPERVAVQVEEATARRDGLAADLEAARAAHTIAVGTAATSRAEALAAEQSAVAAEDGCRAERAALLKVTATPGLLPAAADGEPPELTAETDTVEGAARLVAAVRDAVPSPDREVDEDALDRSLRAIRDSLGAGWDAEARRGTDGAPVAVEVSGPYGRRVLLDATVQVASDLRRAQGLLTAQQDQALRNLLHGRIAHEVAAALFDARELVDGMNSILGEITTSQGIGVRLEWRTRSDLDPATATALRLLAKDPDARTVEEDASVRTAVAGLVEAARAADPDASYRDVIGGVLDYRTWHELKIYLRRPGRSDEVLSRRTRLSEGEKKLVTYLPMAAAAAASATAHDPQDVGAPRLILLDDAFAKVSEDNHARLFGLLVSLDLDFVVTSERLFGTHGSVPELAITEVLRDPDLRTIALVHYHWDGRHRTELAAS
jgi:uncharacterized protein (TIGR02680 family)